MTTEHAWFSQQAALVLGSSVYRKLGGSTVNVTRTSPVKELSGRYRFDEKYVGEVVAPASEGCVRSRSRVRGIMG